MDNRGVVIFRARARQVRDYSGIRYGEITPTDIDGYFEMNDMIFVFFELKYADTDIPFGQNLALERLADAIMPPRKSLLVYAKHYFPVEQDIYAADCEVTAYRSSRKWHYPIAMTLKELADRFVKQFGKQRSQND